MIDYYGLLGGRIA